MPNVISKLHRMLKPNGRVLIRDYGLYDLSMIRSQKCLAPEHSSYYREDGTLVTFFSIAQLQALFSLFIAEETKYCTVKSVNRKTQQHLHRVWIHGQFRKI